MNKEHYICIGVLAAAHGVQGAMRVRSLTEEPETIFRFKSLTDESGARVFALKRKGEVKGDFIASIKGVTTRDEAEALRGTKLYVARSALPKLAKREYYEADLVGLEAIGSAAFPSTLLRSFAGQRTRPAEALAKAGHGRAEKGAGMEPRATTARYGIVIALHDYGAGAFLEIKPEHGDSFMLPFSDAFVPEVDVKAGRVLVNVPEGWLSPPNEKETKAKKK